MLKAIKKKLKEYRQFSENKVFYQQFDDYLSKKTFLPSLHIVKQNNIHAYRDKFKTAVFIETGTYLGDMIEAQKEHFKSLYSIELSTDLHLRAVDRFKGDNHVKILQGDSALVLKEVLSTLKEPALFWLDGHYSGGITAKSDKETPILAELEQIIKHDDAHIILIDDARLFTGEHDYPNIPELCNFILSIDANKEIVIADDIIRIIPKM